MIWSAARIAIWRWRRALAAGALSALVLGCTFGIASVYLAQDARLGVVHFPTSCGWQSQRDFTGATSLLHLFQFADALTAVGLVPGLIAAAATLALPIALSAGLVARYGRETRNKPLE